MILVATERGLMFDWLKTTTTSDRLFVGIGM